MTYLNTLLGWAAVVLIVLFIAALFYVDVSARRLLTTLAREEGSDAVLRSAAEAVLGKGFRARLNGLKSIQASLRGDDSTRAQTTLRIYSFCWIAIVVLFALWAIAMLTSKT